MAKGDEQRRPPEQTVRMPIVEGKHFETFHCDGCFVGLKADDVGALISVAGTRVDIAIDRETYRAVKDGDFLRQTNVSNLESSNRKVIETTIMMRPDHALAMAAAILNQIANLAPHFKIKYNIPPIDMVGQGGGTDVV